MTIEEFESVIPVGSNCKVFEARRYDNQELQINAVYLGSEQHFLKFKRGSMEFQLPLVTIKDAYESKIVAPGAKAVRFEEP